MTKYFFVFLLSVVPSNHSIKAMELTKADVRASLILAQMVTSCNPSTILKITAHCEETARIAALWAQHPSTPPACNRCCEEENRGIPQQLDEVSKAAELLIKMKSSPAPLDPALPDLLAP